MPTYVQGQERSGSFVYSMLRLSPILEFSIRQSLGIFLEIPLFYIALNELPWLSLGNTFSSMVLKSKLN